LSCLPLPTDKNLTSDLKEDAAVYHLSPSLAIVQTLDFITPILNDPYAFGAVAASNAIGDIYAMGAKPVFALNVVEFPVRSLPLSILEEILRGGADKAKEAGVSIAGGHSVEDNAPKYGMAVTGFADPARLVRKKGAKPGDILFLTKPLGTGILTTAIDRGLAGEETDQQIYRIMAHLNKGAAEAMLAVGVNACTDVTGFGLLGHLSEMVSAGAGSAQITLDKVPLIDGVKSLVKSGAIPAGTYRNYRYLQDKVSWQAGIAQDEVMLLCDAQTAGGLLIAVSEDKADQLQAALNKAGCLATGAIGHVTKKGGNLVEVFF
jgi:selenide,water dikinase